MKFKIVISYSFDFVERLIMRKGIKWAIFAILCFAFVLVVFHQPKGKIEDNTDKNGFNLHTTKNNDEKEDAMIFNPNVHVYMGDEAEVVNAAIAEVEYNGINLDIIFEADTKNEFVELNEGEIFFLEGDTNTPLGETYIGKVIEKDSDDEEICLSAEAPMIDEVFDEFYVDDEFTLTEETINTIHTIEGVTVTPVQYLESDFLEMETAECDEEKIIPLKYEKNAKVTEEKILSDKNGFIVELNVDLDEVLNLLQGNEKEKQKEKEEDEEERKNTSASSDCTLTGKIGVEDIKLNYTADWDKDTYGMKELSAGVSGKTASGVELALKYEGELSAVDTEKKLGSVVKLQGLKEKLFPIAYFDCTSSKKILIGKKINETIETTQKMMPFSCGILFYLDIYGNISYEAVLNYEHTNQFSTKLVLVKDNQWIGKFEGESDPKNIFSAKMEVAADGDAHLGLSAMLYFYNLNIADIAIGKFGAEAEGRGILEASTETEGNAGAYGSFYARIYAKIIDVKVNFKVRVDLWNIADVTGNYEFAGILFDFTLAETGKKSSTHYNKELMTWGKMTAEDEKAIYYKSLDNTLIREKKNGMSRVEIYGKDFFEICGVDQSYIYVTEPKTDSSYNLRRVSKDGTRSKVIMNNIKYVLMLNENYIYYVPAFSPNEIYRIDRTELKKEKFVQLEDNVEFMMEEKEGELFVITEKEDMFSFLFGTEVIYYRLAKDGTIRNRYEGEITPENCMLEEMDNYIVSYKLISNGYLRTNAQEVYWMSPNKTKHINTEGTAGWAPKEIGIFVTQEREDGKFDIVLYRANDGKEQRIVTVNNKYAFFSLLQDKRGNWYYIDQTEKELELYKLVKGFSRKELLEKISLKDVPCNLEQCSMEIVNNRLFFYTMPSWSESKVLYRYYAY